MKTKCPKCGTGKARRTCPKEGDVEICSACCASIRDADCGDCVHYPAVRQYENIRNLPPRLPGGHFIIEVNPELDHAVNHALEFAERGQPSKARGILTALLLEHPQNHSVAFGMGVVHVVTGEHVEAIRWFDKAIAIYPYSVESHYNRAVAFQKLLDIPNCIRAYQKVVEVGDPKDPEVAQARSVISHISAGIQKNEGVKLAVYLKSSDLFSQAFTLMEAGDWQGALDGFRASIAIHDHSAPCHGNMGLCHLQLGQKAGALAEFDRALEIDPDYQPARSNREVAERMEEGTPLTHTTWHSVSYVPEGLQKNLP